VQTYIIHKNFQATPNNKFSQQTKSCI